VWGGGLSTTTKKKQKLKYVNTTTNHKQWGHWVVGCRRCRSSRQRWIVGCRRL
jgi:hypothetical protein